MALLAIGSCLIASPFSRSGVGYVLTYKMQVFLGNWSGCLWFGYLGTPRDLQCGFSLSLLSEYLYGNLTCKNLAHQ